MRDDYPPYRTGDRLSAERLNDADDDRRRLGRLRVEPPLELYEGPDWRLLRLGDITPVIRCYNIGAVDIPAWGLMELVQYYSDKGYWDIRRPTSSGMVKIAVNNQYPIKASGPGIAYDRGFVRVLCDSNTDANRWVTTKVNDSTALSVTARTNMKVYSQYSATPNVWWCRFGSSL